MLYIDYFMIVSQQLNSLLVEEDLLKFLPPNVKEGFRRTKREHASKPEAPQMVQPIRHAVNI